MDSAAFPAVCRRGRAVFCFFLVLFLVCLLHTASAAKLSGEWSYQSDPSVTQGQGHDVAMSAMEHGEEWKRFRFPEPPPVPIGGMPVWITTEVMNDDLPSRDGMLLFQTKETSFSLWADGRLIYSYGGPDGVRGSAWHIVKLPPSDKDVTHLAFELRHPDASFSRSISYLSVGTALAQTERAFIYDLPIVVALPVTLLLVVVISIYYFNQASWRRLYRSVIIFLLTFACWLFTKSVLRQLYFFDSLSMQYFSYVLVYLLPITGNLIIREVVERKWKKIVSAISCLWWAVLAGTLIMDVAGQGGISFGLSVFLPVFVLVDAANLYIIWKSGKQGNPYSYALFFALSSFVALAIADALNAHFSFFRYYTCFEPFAIFFSLYFILQLIHGQLLKEQNLELKAVRLRKEAEDAVRRSETDALTQCWNRQKFNRTLSEMTSVSSIFGKKKLAFVMFDIDKFKSFNDDFGHKMGDQVLKRFADTVRENLEDGQEFFRWGGEEFVLIFYSRSIVQAAESADRIRKAVSAGGLCEKRRVTVSCGLSFWHGGSDTPDALFKRADDALYKAKGDGRNCLRIEEATK